jgi:hypothetical protein
VERLGGGRRAGERSALGAASRLAARRVGGGAGTRAAVGAGPLTHATTWREPRSCELTGEGQLLLQAVNSLGKTVVWLIILADLIVGRLVGRGVGCMEGRWVGCGWRFCVRVGGVGVGGGGGMC